VAARGNSASKRNSKESLPGYIEKGRKEDEGEGRSQRKNPMG